MHKKDKDRQIETRKRKEREREGGKGKDKMHALKDISYSSEPPSAFRFCICRLYMLGSCFRAKSFISIKYSEDRLLPPFSMHR